MLQCRKSVTILTVSPISALPQCPISRASSTGRCNTIQCIDSIMLARENHLFGCTRSRPSESSVPPGLTLASDFGFCFQCQEGSSLVLRRPIETTALIRHYASWFILQLSRETPWCSSPRLLQTCAKVKVINAKYFGLWPRSPSWFSQRAKNLR